MRFSLHVPTPTPLRLSTPAGRQVSLPSRLREGLMPFLPSRLREGVMPFLPSRLREGLGVGRLREERATGGSCPKRRIGRNVPYLNQRLVALFAGGAA